MDTPHSTMPEEDEIEITDLAMLVSPEETKISSFQLGILKLQRPLSRRKFRLLTAMSILALVAFVIFANVQGDLAILGNARDVMASFLIQHHLLASNVPAAPVAIKPTTVILLYNDGFACVSDASWSPDSKYVALLGNQLECGGSNVTPGILTIHDASSGKRVRSFLLDDLIMQTFHNHYAKIHTQANIYYHFVLWSHDDHHLAILFNAIFFHEPQQPSFDGLLLLDTKGGPPDVFVHVDQPLPQSYLVWDIQQGTEFIAPAATSGNFQNPGFTISPSVFYRWGNGGGVNELQSVQNKEASGLSHNAIGNPDGGNSFTLWQPGQIAVTTGGGNGAFLPGVASWSTDFAAWSPDGRYIVDNLVVDGRFNVLGRPNPDHQTLVQLAMDLLPVLPIRDKGLQRILQVILSNPVREYPIGVASALASWRFDGQALAAYGASDPYDTSVNIYRCTDGAQVATLLPSSPVPRVIGGGTILRWSDDGSRVLLFNVNAATVAIWNVPTTL